MSVPFITAFESTAMLEYGLDHAYLKRVCRGAVFDKLDVFTTPGVSYTFKYTEQIRAPYIGEIATSAGIFVSRIDVYAVMDACL